MASYGAWGCFGLILLVGACGGKVVLDDEDVDAGGNGGSGGSGGSGATGGTGAVGGTGATGGMGGTGATGGMGGTGATGGMGGTGATGGMGGTAAMGGMGGTGGAPVDVMGACMTYLPMIGSDMSFECSECVESALMGPCGEWIDTVIDESPPCGQANHCANYQCGQEEEPAPELCQCLVDCLAPAPAECSVPWANAFGCLSDACGSVCPN